MIIAIAALATTIPAMRPRCTHVSGGERLEIPIADLARGATSFFCYSDAGDQVRFILARDDEGVVHSVLDACHQCSSFHKGYTASRGEVICRLCGNRYPIRALEAGKASCVPATLPNRQHDGLVEVKVADLKQGRQLF
ncbi:MAG: Fe-S-containing protein [Stellaceae bacterium]